MEYLIGYSAGITQTLVGYPCILLKHDYKWEWNWK